MLLLEEEHQVESQCYSQEQSRHQTIQLEVAQQCDVFFLSSLHHIEVWSRGSSASLIQLPIFLYGSLSVFTNQSIGNRTSILPKYQGMLGRRSTCVGSDIVNIARLFQVGMVLT